MVREVTGILTAQYDGIQQNNGHVTDTSVSFKILSLSSSLILHSLQCLKIFPVFPESSIFHYAAHVVMMKISQALLPITCK